MQKFLVTNPLITRTSDIRMYVRTYYIAVWIQQFRLTIPRNYMINPYRLRNPYKYYSGDHKTVTYVIQKAIISVKLSENNLEVLAMYVHMYVNKFQ